MFKIGGFQKSTLIDYPGKIAAIVFTQGCNFRCGYCHNPELLDLKSDSKLSVQYILDFLKTRKGKLDGVVITGGEPTMQAGLYEFIKSVKSLGFLVKLDTNGSNPETIKKLVSDSLIDYIAMDIKAPLEKYKSIVGVGIDTDKIKQSIEIIMNSGIEYEFRTTVVKSLLSFDDILKMGEMIKGADKYYLQKFDYISVREQEAADICLNKFDVNYGGSEANVAISLANYGINSVFITKIPSNEIGQAAINTLRQYNVDTNSIVRGGERLGIYYMEKGASQRPSKVIYDRAYSSISQAKPTDFNWDEIFNDAEWFHIAGITPA